jgi:hypothetical protein
MDRACITHRRVETNMHDVVGYPEGKEGLEKLSVKVKLPYIKEYDITV